MLEAIINARRKAANIVLLTSLGGGAFGNAPEWIHAAIKRAVKKVQGFDLDARLERDEFRFGHIRRWRSSWRIRLSFGLQY